MAGRLSLALEKGIISLSDGDTLVIGAMSSQELEGLDPAHTRVLWRYMNVHHEITKAGWTSVKETETGGPANNVIVFLPRSRDLQQAYLRLAREHTDGPIIVDGPKTNGVETILRDIKARVTIGESWSKAHGKVFTFEGGVFSDWPSPEPTLRADGWWRAPGVFSADGVDKASALLADVLPGALKGSIVDLGAGWGYLSRAILECEGVTALTLVENDETALRAAAHNIDDARATLELADALRWQPNAPVDHVVTNPPFHIGRAADPALGQGFIRAAAAMLKPKGQLWLVANRQLPYEETLGDAFRTVEQHADTPSFKVFHATSPKRRKG